MVEVGMMSGVVLVNHVFAGMVTGLTGIFVLSAQEMKDVSTAALLC